ETQDFVMIDHPVFFVRNVAEYLPFMEDFRRFETGEILSKTCTGLKFLLSPFHQFRLLRAAGSKKPDSPLGTQYWSTTPFKLGPHAIKFSARPDLAGVPAPPASGSPDK